MYDCAPRDIQGQFFTVFDSNGDRGISKEELKRIVVDFLMDYMEKRLVASVFVKLMKNKLSIVLSKIIML